MVQEEQGLNTKTDRSLVTTADYASQARPPPAAANAEPSPVLTPPLSQALISKLLADAFGADVSLVAEEDSGTLREGPEGAAMLQRVTAAVNDALAGAGAGEMSEAEVLEAIDRGGRTGGPHG